MSQPVPAPVAPTVPAPVVEPEAVEEEVTPPEGLANLLDLPTLDPEPEAEAIAPADEPVADEPEEDEPLETPAVEDEPEAAPAPAPASEPADVASPAPQPQAPAADDTAARAYAAAVHKFNADLAAHDARTSAEGYEYDPYVDGKEAARLQREHIRLTATKVAQLEQVQQAAAQQTEWQKFWTDYGRQNPAIGNRGEAMFQDELKKAQKLYANPEAAHAVAEQRFADRVKLVNAKAAAAAAAKNPPAPGTKGRKPVTAGGARVMPVGAPAARPPVSQDPADEFAAKAGGKMKNFLS